MVKISIVSPLFSSSPLPVFCHSPLLSLFGYDNFSSAVSLVFKFPVSQIPIVQVNIFFFSYLLLSLFPIFCHPSSFPSSFVRFPLFPGSFSSSVSVVVFSFPPKVQVKNVFSSPSFPFLLLSHPSPSRPLVLLSFTSWFVFFISV